MLLIDFNCNQNQDQNKHVSKKNLVTLEFPIHFFKKDNDDNKAYEAKIKKWQSTQSPK